MAITFGLMLQMGGAQMGGAPAAAVPPVQPVQQPIIEAQVISSSQVQQVGNDSGGQMGLRGYMGGYKSAPQRTFPTYDMHGERRHYQEPQGSGIDLFA